MEKRVCLDPGHGGRDPGAVYGDLKEKDIVLDVADYAVEGLQAIDPEIWVCMTRSSDQAVTLQQRCAMANKMNVDCFVSIHCNADPDPDSPEDPEAKGEEIWIFKGSLKGLTLAKSLQTEVDLIFPDEPFRGIKTSESFYVLKHTKAPACLIEIGFIDKSSSWNLFSDELCLRKIGALIARGIFNYLKSKEDKS